MTDDQYLGKAQKNAAFAASISIDSPIAIGWVITIRFYVALYYVQAYFSTIGRTFRSHGARDSAIQRDPGISSIYDDYRELEDYSKEARYEHSVLTPADLDYASGTLKRIEVKVRSVLGQ